MRFVCWMLGHRWRLGEQSAYAWDGWFWICRRCGGFTGERPEMFEVVPRKEG